MNRFYSIALLAMTILFVGCDEKDMIGVITAKEDAVASYNNDRLTVIKIVRFLDSEGQEHILWDRCNQLQTVEVDQRCVLTVSTSVEVDDIFAINRAEIVSDEALDVAELKESLGGPKIKLDDEEQLSQVNRRLEHKNRTIIRLEERLTAYEDELDALRQKLDDKEPPTAVKADEKFVSAQAEEE